MCNRSTPKIELVGHNRVKHYPKFKLLSDEEKAFEQRIQAVRFHEVCLPAAFLPIPLLICRSVRLRA